MDTVVLSAIEGRGVGTLRRGGPCPIPTGTTIVLRVEVVRPTVVEGRLLGAPYRGVATGRSIRIGTGKPVEVSGAGGEPAPGV